MSSNPFLLSQVVYDLSDYHKVHICKKFHCVRLLVGIGTLPPPLSPVSVSLPPEPKGGGGGHSPADKGLEGVPIPTTREKSKPSAYSVLEIVLEFLNLVLYIDTGT
jgi:hypothetical protein